MFTVDRKNHIKQEKSEIVATTEIITPEIAKKLLDSQGVNRRFKEAHIERLCQDMKNGHWMIGDPIKIDNTGQLIDGQHRLAAVIRSKRPQAFLVLRGYLPESKQVLDTGVSRTAANIGQLLGKDITDSDQAVINKFHLPNTCNSVANKKSATIMLHLFDTYQDGLKFLRFSKQLSTGSVIGLNSILKSLIAKAYYYENHRRLEEFCDVFRGGFAISPNAEDDHAAIALRNYTLQKRQNKESIDTYVGRLEYYLIGQELLEKFIKKIPVKRIVKKDREPIDRYPLPHIHGDWSKYGKRYGYMNNDTQNGEIRSKMIELMEEWKIKSSKH
jgi:hypothetical protein